MSYRHNVASTVTHPPTPADHDRDLVPFGASCPWCGHANGHPTHVSRAFNHQKKYTRRLVRPRTWSFLWWRARPAHFSRTCEHCGGAYRELTKDAAS
jgi:hypothetical protein